MNQVHTRNQIGTISHNACQWDFITYGGNMDNSYITTAKNVSLSLNNNNNKRLPALTSEIYLS